MSTTTDISSITNSVMMVMEKELRKHGIAPQFHDHYVGNRTMIEGMIAMMMTPPTPSKESE